MAINVYTSHVNTPIRVKYFAHKHFNNDTALKETKNVKGVFYARKHGTTETSSYITAAGAKAIMTKMQLYTDDFIDDLEIDDFVVFKGKKLLVVAIEDADRVRHRGKVSWQGSIITVRG